MGKSENQIDEASRRLKSDRVIEYLETPHQINAKLDRIDWVDLAPSETHAMQINCELLFFSQIIYNLNFLLGSRSDVSIDRRMNNWFRLILFSGCSIQWSGSENRSIYINWIFSRKQRLRGIANERI